MITGCVREVAAVAPTPMIMAGRPPVRARALVVAAPASGSGKTTVATGLMAALHRRGTAVAPFKVGPDYIDPGYHTLAAGRPGRNLDPVLVGADRIAPLARHGAAGAEIAVVEGVMGLFDGRLADGYGSTAQVAGLLGAPVVLVVDARGQSRSLAALLHGFRSFDPAVDLAGVVLNRVGSTRHEDVLRAAAAEVGLPVLGALPRREALAVPSRHLGLVTAVEHGAAALAAVDAMAELVSRARRPRRADGAGPTPPGRTAVVAPPSPCPGRTTAPVAGRIDRGRCRGSPSSVARRSPSATPSTSSCSPRRVPRSWSSTRCATWRSPSARPRWCCPAASPRSTSARSSANVGLRAAVRALAASGAPVHAECGGLLYLCATLDGAPMCGVLPAHAAMTERLTLGYRDAVALAPSVAAPRGRPRRGPRVPPLRRDPARGRRGVGVARRGARGLRPGRRPRLVPAHPPGGCAGRGRALRRRRGVISRSGPGRATVGSKILTGEVVMADRLSPLDASFLFMEEPTTAMHVGGLMTFDATPGFDPDRFIALIGERLAAVPRYRQKIREVPARLGLPLWVDDPAFELDFHVRRSALPAPGTDEQLRELVGRLQSRQLDRSRPLWEIYLIEGLDRDRFAIVTKTHHAMVDGLSSIDIGAVLLDLTPTPAGVPARRLGARAGAVRSRARRRRGARAAAQAGGWLWAPRSGPRSDVRTLMRTGGAMLAAARSASRPAPANPLNAPIGRHRRFGTSAGALDDYKAIRKEHGGTVNDVILAVVSGGLRRWMTTRGEPVLTSTTVRALVPVSVRARGTGGTAGNQISALFVDLPVGEPDPVARLKVVSAAMAGHKGSGQAIGAGALIGLVGLATPTVHSMGARLTSSMSSRMFNVIVTNVPGPQFPLYAMGARMRDIYPVVPLAKGQAVSIGITSYDGGVFYGLNADRDAMGDVDVLAEAIGESLDELRARESAMNARTGLVLGAGGILGSAWMAGALPAVQERVGRPLGELDLVLGTSAGSVLGAALRCGMSVEELLAHQRGATPAEIADDLGDGDLPDMRTLERESGDGRPPLPLPWIGSPRLVAHAVTHPRSVNPVIAASGLLPAGRGRMGSLVRMVGALQARLGVTADGWVPGAPLWVVAVDYDSGRRIVFGRHGRSAVPPWRRRSWRRVRSRAGSRPR